MNETKENLTTNKSPLAYKSIPEIIWTIAAIVLAGVVALQLLDYYAFDIASMPEIIYFMTIALLLVFLGLAIYLVVLIRNPKVLMYWDAKGIYVVKRKKERFIPFDEIEKVHATISIWAKPFLVYTSLVIMHQDVRVVVRNIKDMAGVRDQIRHQAFKS